MENLIMQQFTGTKTIKACGMNKHEAEKVLGRKINDQQLDEPGYLVEYPDGYKSWSPAKAFEEAYRPSETHLDRMKIEQEELKNRYMKGRDFSFTQKFCDLGTIQRNLLHRQLNVMEDYLYILGERISYEEHALAPDPGINGSGKDDK